MSVKIPSLQTLCIVRMAKDGISLRTSAVFRSMDLRGKDTRLRFQGSVLDNIRTWPGPVHKNVDEDISIVCKHNVYESYHAVIKWVSLITPGQDSESAIISRRTWPQYGRKHPRHSCNCELQLLRKLR